MGCGASKAPPQQKYEPGPEPAPAANMEAPVPSRGVKFDAEASNAGRDASPLTAETLKTLRGGDAAAHGDAEKRKMSIFTTPDMADLGDLEGFDELGREQEDAAVQLQAAVRGRQVRSGSADKLAGPLAGIGDAAAAKDGPRPSLLVNVSKRDPEADAAAPDVDNRLDGLDEFEEAATEEEAAAIKVEAVVRGKAGRREAEAKRAAAAAEAEAGAAVAAEPAEAAPAEAAAEAPAEAAPAEAAPEAAAPAES